MYYGETDPATRILSDRSLAPVPETRAQLYLQRVFGPVQEFHLETARSRPYVYLEAIEGRRDRLRQQHPDHRFSQAGLAVLGVTESASVFSAMALETQRMGQPDSYRLYAEVVIGMDMATGAVVEAETAAGLLSYTADDLVQFSERYGEDVARSIEQELAQRQIRIDIPAADIINGTVQKLKSGEIVLPSQLTPTYINAGAEFAQSLWTILYPQCKDLVEKDPRRQ